MLPEPTLFVAFLLASLVVIVAPGPDVLYVVSRSIGQGRWAGIVAVAGTSSGLMVHATAAALGLSGLFLHAPLAYEVLRYAGVGYLLYLAWRAFTARDAPEFPQRKGAQGLGWGRVYRQAALTNLLNPKVALFFIAFLPQFVDAQGGHAFAQIILLAALFVAAGVVFLLALALTFGRIGDWLRTRPAFWRVQRWIMGTTLGGLALWLALPERR
jgi:threonine/homoserine/homoserine lactone efflux protein